MGTTQEPLEFVLLAQTVDRPKLVWRVDVDALGEQAHELNRNSSKGG
jgi:hypothetical protein